MISNKILIIVGYLTSMCSFYTYNMTIAQIMMTGDCVLVQNIIAANPYFVYAQDSIGMAPLHYATRHGNTQLVQLLIRSNAPINQPSTANGLTPLHYAVLHDFQAIALFLLASGAMANLVDKHGMTPTHLAAARNHTSILQMLISAGRAHLDIPDANGSTALHLACAKGHKEAAQILIDAGATINPRDSDGYMPHHIATLYGHHDTAALIQTRMGQGDAYTYSVLPNHSIIVNNAGIPIEKMWITESSYTVRLGEPRSPQHPLTDRGLWDIPVHTGCTPYIFAIAAYNKIFQWILPSFKNELMLVQYRNGGIMKLELQQHEEFAGDKYYKNITPMMNEISLQ